MSQKQRNESNSLSPHGPPFTDISCGFFLTLSLTHSTERKARFMFWGKKEKAREREGGEEGGEAESSSTFTLPLSAGVRGSGKQGVCFARCFYFKKEKNNKNKNKPSLFVRRKGTPKSFRVLGEKKKRKKSGLERLFTAQLRITVHDFPVSVFYSQSPVLVCVVNCAVRCGGFF